MSDIDTVNAAGCLVYRRKRGALEVLVVHRPNYDDWSFPKGKCDKGETDYDCALRETLEETGFKVDPIGELSEVSYKLASGKNKLVRFWYAEKTGGKFKQNSEVDAAEWLDIESARGALSYDRDKELLDEFFTLVN